MSAVFSQSRSVTIVVNDKSNCGSNSIHEGYNITIIPHTYVHRKGIYECGNKSAPGGEKGDDPAGAILRSDSKLSPGFPFNRTRLVLMDGRCTLDGILRRDTIASVEYSIVYRRQYYDTGDLFSKHKQLLSFFISEFVYLTGFFFFLKVYTYRNANFLSGDTLIDF